MDLELKLCITSNSREQCIGGYASQFINNVEQIIIMNFLTLSAKLADEKAAAKFFQIKGIIPEEKECSKEHQMKMEFGKYIRWRCYIKECREECGIRIGTWFQDTRLSFPTAAIFIHSWEEQRSSMDFCKKKLEMNPSTTVD
ncbi:Hypothetical protein SRAE_X000180300 [Strongyloides ratti]|uniref:Uncharacterized protein n=1 Tax=Strongyloides ratti TaxID=34506 RepID=A0A090KXU7_STRRB|nr:Hypothetical protein SRAE_X000180300 [Strongyloides ratti]CEF60063.1 Hypothetical protein SRAE_X000180300 [Strongyloides ratti]